MPDCGVRALERRALSTGAPAVADSVINFGYNFGYPFEVAS
jgi:hypothetical protein